MVFILFYNVLRTVNPLFLRGGVQTYWAGD